MNAENDRKWPFKISPYWAAAVVVAIIILALMLYSMGRPWVCACGQVKLLHLIVQSPENSQHIADWYAPSHIVHGFIFYFFSWLARRQFPSLSLGALLFLSVLVEGAWEIAENSPAVIDRYRAVTISWGYSGDSIVNSVADICWMLFGFFLASRLPWKVTVLLALFMELFVGYMIRDNLSLNILMLAAPSEAVKEWQADADGYWVTGKKK